MMWIRQRLIFEDRSAFSVSTIMRRPSHRRWSLTRIKAISGTLGQLVLGSNNLKLVAFVRKAPEVETEKLPEADLKPGEVKVQGADIDTHCPSQKCPWCRAYKGCKYRAKHTDACKRRFEALLAKSVKGGGRFEWPERGG